MTQAEAELDGSVAPLPPLWKRVVDVFVAPGEMFEKLAANPKWVGAALLGGVLVAISGVLIPLEMYEDLVRAQMMEAGQDVPGDPAQMAMFGKAVGSIAGPIFYVLVSLIFAGMATLVFAFVLGDRGRFSQYFAATAHAFLIYALGAVAVTPLRIAAGDPQFLLSPGAALTGMLPNGYFLDVLSSIDVFSVWAYAVLAIAVTKIDTKRGFGTAFAFLMVLGIGFSMLAALGR